MAYYTDLFSPETYEAFSRSPRDVTGFRLRHQNVAARIRPGDTLVCYVTRVSRWCGLLDVVKGPYIDDAPIFAEGSDPYVVRFKVVVRVWLELEAAVPIHANEVWSHLSFTKNLSGGSVAWTGKLRGSLVRLDADDGALLARVLTTQTTAPVHYAFDESDRKALKTHLVNREDQVVYVSVPTESEADASPQKGDEPEGRESHRIQSLLAQIGATMGLSIWIPPADRESVRKLWRGEKPQFLTRLPLNYDDVTLRTVEQIDVLWLKGRSIVRAFEVEHTTSVYSGILRMADLPALQPNMDIRLHIVAPEARREKVFAEMRRPVFSLLERGPLADSCSYLSYSSVDELASQRHLAHLSDSVLDEYAEDVSDA